MNRRQFLFTMAGMGLMPFVAHALPGEKKSQLAFLSARADHLGRYFFSGVNEQGKLQFDVPLPARGHGMAVDPTHRHAIAFARRPGDFLVAVDMLSGEVVHQSNAASERHFFGHGVFSHDGRWLYTTENNLTTDRGVIGIRDVNDGYRQVGEIPSHGIGPHELKLAADGKTLVIANGGILTRPETGRSKLNIDSMSPSLAYVDSQSGRLLSEHKLPGTLHKNSIRHMAINADDTVCIGLQYQGSHSETPLLVGLHRAGEDIRLLETPKPILARMRNYCGSVCVDASGDIFAVSSPRGNLVTFWSASEQRYLGHTDIKDGCGIAATGMAGEFFISSGTGQVMRYSLTNHHQQVLPGFSEVSARWDNHML